MTVLLLKIGHFSVLHQTLATYLHPPSQEAHGRGQKTLGDTVRGEDRILEAQASSNFSKLSFGDRGEYRKEDKQS